MKNKLLLIGIELLILFALVEPGNAQDSDFIRHRIESPYQADSTTIRVLLPENIVPGESYKVLYVLPVVENDSRRYGGGLDEIKKYDYHNQYNLICVAPEFTAKPWFCDYEGDPGRQDESHFLKTVIPYIDDQYPTLKSKEGRLLMGFSKSGRGAFSLILRNPEMFHRAAGWDSGIRIDAGPMSEEEKAERIETLFGSVSNFEKYHITSLLKNRGAELGEEEARLFLYSTEGKRAIGSAEIHSLMVELKIPHYYLFEPHRPHRWDSGWIPETVRFLIGEYH
jgi:hypothetical protein